ncbi:hypothetical protein [Petropleomorpha daqingensis]|uniref:Uncharacterized protein n=1 Tax=Petropleomorpha daqingensis TaxID=2026353 RepID=A0A853CDZ6_9ACTN|nr:hypothetical protein [Petropleomorpha daqingensis]NYJ05336.1 hypothetical protein [Petropleomorpha daqingensis]
MALARRALLLAFVAVCALLLAVGVVGPGQPPRDHGTTGAVAAGTAAAPGATPELSTSVSKQTSPLVLLATSEPAATRRSRHRVRPVGRRSSAHRHGRRPAPRPGGRAAPRGRHRRLRPEPIAGVDEQLARMALELNVLVGSFRY